MRTKTWFVIVFVILFAQVSRYPVQAQIAEPSDAWILDITCKAQRSSSGVTKVLSKVDVGLALKAGDKVRCTNPGRLVLQLGDGVKTVSLSDNWFTISPVPQNPRYPEIVNALKRYGQPGASRNAGVPTIRWPTTGSVVTAKNFVIRWSPTQSRIRFTIETQTTHHVIWGPADTDGSSGEWVATQARAVLADYQAQKTDGKAQEEFLTLVLSNGGITDSSQFSLLDPKNERDLRASLDFWEQYDNRISRLLGRGYLFSRYGLYEEAATEYEAALEQVPESRYLLEESLRADYRVGRVDKAQKLDQQLRALPKDENSR